MSFNRAIIVNTFVVLITFSWTLPTIGQQNSIPSSPCPNVFQYKNFNDQWFGVIEVPSPPLDHREVILQLSLSLRATTNVSGSHGYGQDHNTFFFNFRKEKKPGSTAYVEE